MNSRKIRGEADGLFLEAMREERGDRKIYLALAYGLYSYLEEDEKRNLCERHLRVLGIDGEKLKNLKEKACYACGIGFEIGRRFGRQEDL